MRVSDRAVVLSAIRHGDRKLIVKLFCEREGLVTALAVPSRSPQSRVKPAALLPLTFIDAVLDMRASRELHTVTEATAFHAPDLAGSIQKLTIAQFINELMLKTFRDQHAAAEFFSLAEATFVSLEAAEGNFGSLHLRFMLRLTALLGIEPHNDRTANNRYFDMREGRFSSLSLPYPMGLDEATSRLLADFLSGQSGTVSRAERQQLLDVLINYYRLHVPGFSELRSLAVLREVLS